MSLLTTLLRAAILTISTADIKAHKLNDESQNFEVERRKSAVIDQFETLGNVETKNWQLV